MQITKTINKVSYQFRSCYGSWIFPEGDGEPSEGLEQESDTVSVTTRLVPKREPAPESPASLVIRQLGSTHSHSGLRPADEHGLAPLPFYRTFYRTLKLRTMKSRAWGLTAKWQGWDLPDEFWDKIDKKPFGFQG